MKKAVNPCQILVGGVKKDLTIHKKQIIVCYYKERRKCLYSSVVEQSLDKAWVVGSNPTRGTILDLIPLV